MSWKAHWPGMTNTVGALPVAEGNEQSGVWYMLMVQACASQCPMEKLREPMLWQPGTHTMKARELTLAEEVSVQSPKLKNTVSATQRTMEIALTGSLGGCPKNSRNVWCVPLELLGN